METRRAFVRISLTFWLLALLRAHATGWAADKETDQKDKRVAGILIDRTDQWITVKSDGEDEPIKYPLGATVDKKVNDAMKMIFNASRVQLTYKQEGDTRKLASINKQPMRAKGTVTGEVVKVYNDFWVEIKTKSGPNDAYAASPNNWQDKAFMEKLKGLKKGDSVTITFYTDFERHRIMTLKKN